MHILLIHQAFATLDEAGGTRHFELARYLVKRGHRITIIASPISYLTGKKSSQDNRRTPEPGITILRAYTYRALHRNFIHRVLSFLSFMISSFILGMQIRNVDLVWGTSPPIFQGATAWLLARLNGAIFVFEVRDLWPAFAIAVGVLRNPWLVGTSLWLERFLYQHADRVMVNSPGFVDHVIQKGARSVEMVPNGADPTMFNPKENGEDFRHRYILGDKFIALYAGAHGLSNDLGTVLAASEILLPNSNICIVLIGDGKDKPALQEMAQSKGLTNVVFVSPAAKAGMSTVLAAASACIAILKPLELYKTTYPNKVFDYMAAGRPVILAIDGVIRTVVEEAGAGIFVPPGDPQALANAILFLAANPSRAIQMGMNGRKCVEQSFSRAELAEKLTQIFEELVKNNV